MILDAIIGLFASIFGALVEALALVFVPVINLIAAGVEAVVGILVSGFSLGRIQGKKIESRSPASAIAGILPSLLIVGVIGWLVIAPNVLNRDVTLIAVDGHSLPFAAVIVHTKDGDEHKRTDRAGSIVIPRFSIAALTVKDPRYVEKTWRKSEIKSELIVGRTILGSGLDVLADHLLKPKGK